jgi:acyl-CoA thioester hydrolase
MTGMPRHRVLTPLRWSDMDAYGHVNNVQFLRIIEDARVVAFAAAGTDEGGSLVNTGLLVARSEIEYLQPLVYRTAPVAIDLWVTSLAGASFEMAYEVLDEGGWVGTNTHGSREHGGHEHSSRQHPSGPQLYARAETTMVVYDLAKGRPRRLAPEERARLEAWRDGPVAWRRRHRNSAG